MRESRTAYGDIRLKPEHWTDTGDAPWRKSTSID